MQQVQVKYEGRVQGVGFRFTVVDLAAGLEVSGTVRNASDGSVRLIAQGSEQALGELMTRISQRFERNIIMQTPVWAEISAATVTGFRIEPDLLT